MTHAVDLKFCVNIQLLTLSVYNAIISSQNLYDKPAKETYLKTGKKININRTSKTPQSLKDSVKWDLKVVGENSDAVFRIRLLGLNYQYLEDQCGL